MAQFMRLSHLTIMTVALTLGLAVNLPLQVKAQPRTTSLRSQIPLQWEPPGTSSPTPVNRESGGTRGPDPQSRNECIQSEQKLVALVPASGTGTTISPYPTIYWYMPPTTASEVYFLLKDANGQQVYSVKYNLARSAEGKINTAGIMSLPLPALANLSPLKSGQTYEWSLILVCDPTDNSGNPVVEGNIQRVEPTPALAQRLQEATPQERLGLYATNRDWYETVRTLAELRRDFPNDPDVEQAWQKLLNSVQIKGVSQSSSGGTISQLN